MRLPLTPVIASLLAAAATAGIAIADQSAAPSSGVLPPGFSLGSFLQDRLGLPYSIGLWGDFPYNDVQKTTGVPNLIADMNSQRLAFTVHDGDLKAGSGPCPDSLYTDAKARFNTLTAPAAFTPGDNDWVDCDRNPGTNSLERLNFERSVLFDTPFSLGQKPMRQEVQAPPYVENRRWTVGRVTYATLDVQGSCNNLCDVAPDPNEYAARTVADIAWLRGTFDEAKAANSVAVMVIFQADPGWDNTDATRAPTRDPKTLVENDIDPKTHQPAPDGFHDFLTELRTQVIAFRKPVVAVHGDSHYFRVDKPLLDSVGQRLENFTRVETFGDHAENNTNDVHWVRVDVDPHSREVFSFQPQIVPANRTAVPTS